MAATKIADLSLIGTVTQNDSLGVVQSGVTKRITVDQIRSLDVGPLSSLGDEANSQWQLAIVTGDTLGPGVDNRSVVYSDGVDWRRMSDGTILGLRPLTYDFNISTAAPTVTVA